MEVFLGLVEEAAAEAVVEWEDVWLWVEVILNLTKESGQGGQASADGQMQRLPVVVDG